MKNNKFNFKKALAIHAIPILAILFVFLPSILIPTNETRADTCYISLEYEKPQCAPDGVKNKVTGGNLNVYLDSAPNPCPPGDECVGPAFTEEQKQQLNEDLSAQRNQQVSTGQVAEYEIPKTCSWLDMLCNTLLGINWIIDSLSGIGFKIANYLFTYMVNINKSSFGGSGTRGLLTAGLIGWSTTRDIANMFFVFFLLWTAIATIFGLEPYTIRQVLPKLIVAALLINFSLPISQLVINTSNALADLFIQNLGEDDLAKPFQYLGINPDATVLKIGSLDSPNLVSPSPDLREKATTLVNNETARVNDEAGGIYSFKIIGCNNLVSIILTGLCHAALTLKSSLDWSVVKINKDNLGETAGQAIARRIGIKIIVIPIALFIIFAAVFMLIARLIHLSFIVILGPLAFLFMILPATQRYYSQWWDALIKWSFFFPAFMFFFWLGVKILNPIAAGKSADYPDTIVSLFIGIGFLIGALIVSQQLGVAVAGTAMNMGKRWTTGARRWAVNRSVGRIKEGGKEALRTKEGRAFTEVMGKIPLVGGMIQRGLGRGEAAGSAAEKERLQRTFGFARRLPVEERSKYIMGLERKQKKDVLEAAGGAEREKLVQGLYVADQKKLIDQLRGLGGEHLVSSATNNPEVIVHAEHPEMQEGYPEYQKQVREETKRFDKGELSPEFLESEHFQKYFKEEGTLKDIQQIYASTNTKVRETFTAMVRDTAEQAEAAARAAGEESVNNAPAGTEDWQKGLLRTEAGAEARKKELDKLFNPNTEQFFYGSPHMRTITGYGVPYERMEKGRGGKIDKEINFFTEAVHRAAFDIDEALKMVEKYNSPEMQRKINASPYRAEARELPISSLENAAFTGINNELYGNYKKIFDLLKKINEEIK